MHGSQDLRVFTHPIIDSFHPQEYELLRALQGYLYHLQEHSQNLACVSGEDLGLRVSRFRREEECARSSRGDYQNLVEYELLLRDFQS